MLIVEAKVKRFVIEFTKVVKGRDSVKIQSITFTNIHLNSPIYNTCYLEIFLELMQRIFTFMYTCMCIL